MADVGDGKDHKVATRDLGMRCPAAEESECGEEEQDVAELENEDGGAGGDGCVGERGRGRDLSVVVGDGGGKGRVPAHCAGEAGGVAVRHPFWRREEDSEVGVGKGYTYHARGSRMPNRMCGQRGRTLGGIFPEEEILQRAEKFEMLLTGLKQESVEESDMTSFDSLFEQVALPAYPTLKEGFGL